MRMQVSILAWESTFWCNVFQITAPLSIKEPSGLVAKHTSPRGVRKRKGSRQPPSSRQKDVKIKPKITVELVDIKNGEDGGEGKEGDRGGREGNKLDRYLHLFC